ncbi:hypothetical protein LGV61_04260 [Desulfurispirillum indicum]|uniref:hypothetical protein n=1 Tax=Desulfurispirillum indicum TaxID=936456 RepID=UPI001CFC0FD7|nr:hypothetical protein [Desulfurispirillum indicum]UCZ57498.1 hypothetical protein LGV61_04260 [Desulfurispirillum indicum]
MINVHDFNPAKGELEALGLLLDDGSTPSFAREEYDDFGITDTVTIWKLLQLRGEHEEATRYWEVIPDELKWPNGALGASNDVLESEGVLAPDETNPPAPRQ